LNSPFKKEINKKVLNSQYQWSEYIVNIGKAYLNDEDYIELTNKFLDNLYNFKNGKVLFKPTKANDKQFRIHKNELVSYFIGHDKVSNEDKGFALEPWKSINFNNFDLIFLDNVCLTMGNYFFTDYKDNKLKVEYSFGYILDKEDNLKIIFHHSSIPYNPNNQLSKN
jgi:hypothetical protein